MNPAPEPRTRRLARWMLGVLFIGAGLLHFTNTDGYVAIMPPYLPAHRALVLVSGVAEILGGLGVLLSAPVRHWAGIGLAVLLIAVVPANLHMALAGLGFDGVPAEGAEQLLLWLRLPLQAVLIAWALWASGVWPRGEQATSAGTFPGRPLRR
ncbi:MAG: DoxX family membrane protein [Rhodothermaceae bacterium]|nr:DoxX family membrane protein [Rhodothermaceae bacterium]